MNKILNYIIIFFFLTLLSCDYKPVLSYKNYQFSINVDKVSGNEEINSIIINNLNNLSGTKESYSINFISKKEKKILSKDSKGDPLIFEIIIDVEINIRSEDKILLKQKLQKKNSYKNKSDKFELEEFENTVIKNLSIIIVENTIAAMSNLK